MTVIVVGTSSYFSESDTKVRFSGADVNVEVEVYEPCRMIWSRGMVSTEWSVFVHEMRRFGFEPMKGKHIGGGGGAIAGDGGGTVQRARGPGPGDDSQEHEERKNQLM